MIDGTEEIPKHLIRTVFDLTPSHEMPILGLVTDRGVFVGYYVVPRYGFEYGEIHFGVYGNGRGNARKHPFQCSTFATEENMEERSIEAILRDLEDHGHHIQKAVRLEMV